MVKNDVKHQLWPSSYIQNRSKENVFSDPSCNHDNKSVSKYIQPSIMEDNVDLSVWRQVRHQVWSDVKFVWWCRKEGPTLNWRCEVWSAIIQRMQIKRPKLKPGMMEDNVDLKFQGPRLKWSNSTIQRKSWSEGPRLKSMMKDLPSINSRSLGQGSSQVQWKTVFIWSRTVKADDDFRPESSCRQKSTKVTANSQNYCSSSWMYILRVWYLLSTAQRETVLLGRWCDCSWFHKGIGKKIISIPNPGAIISLKRADRHRGARLKNPIAVQIGIIVLNRINPSFIFLFHWRAICRSATWKLHWVAIYSLGFPKAQRSSVFALRLPLLHCII